MPPQRLLVIRCAAMRSDDDDDDILTVLAPMIFREPRCSIKLLLFAISFLYRLPARSKRADCGDLLDIQKSYGKAQKRPATAQKNHVHHSTIDTCVQTQNE